MRCSKLILLAIILMTSACASASTKIKANGAAVDPSIYENDLANTRWILKSFGEASQTTPVVKEGMITLNFGTDGRADGSGGCNSYSGGYNADDDEVSFIKVISTKRACADNEASRQEARYFEALSSTGKYDLVDDKLTIFYNDDKKTLNFVKAPASAMPPL